ncbi:MAG: OadG family protein [Clostridia bacterium]|nr:OadG family protein [Clostridia bacterium]
MDRLSLSLSTMGVGMLVVFSGLVILIACIYAMTVVTGRKKAPKAEASPAPKAPAPAPVQAEPEPEEDDGAIIAAITAAIAAVWQAEGKESGFVVRRVRRTQSSTARARAAREEQIFSHF